MQIWLFLLIFLDEFRHLGCFGPFLEIFLNWVQIDVSGRPDIEYLLLLTLEL